MIFKFCTSRVGHKKLQHSEPDHCNEMTIGQQWNTYSAQQSPIKKLASENIKHTYSISQNDFCIFIFLIKIQKRKYNL